MAEHPQTTSVGTEAVSDPQGDGRFSATGLAPTTMDYETDVAGGPVPGPDAQAAAPGETGEPARGRPLLWAALGLTPVVLGVLLWYNLRAAHPSGADGATQGDTARALPVNTVQPKKKTLVRTLTQPGTIRPWAQVEVYAKVSGNLRWMRRVPTPRLATEVLAPALISCSPLRTTPDRAIALGAALGAVEREAPLIDIGSAVATGEKLLEIDAPDRQQLVAEKEALVEQRQAELEQARTSIATFEAAEQAAQAQVGQAQADVKRFEAEHTFRGKELKRLQELKADRTIPQDLVDEKEFQVAAAHAAWESSQVKVKLTQAEAVVVSSKLATARADLKVKEALVRVALSDLREAQILADFCRVCSPLNGVITYRGVDEGDFIQNASSGQARHVLTITAINRVKVVLPVPARDAPWIRVGTKATMVGTEGGGWVAQGVVARMDHVLDLQARTMQIEVDLDNQDRRLLPGMYGYVTLVLQKIPDAFSIPAAAVYSRKGENYIIEVVNGVAHRRLVRLRYDDGVEVEVVRLINGREVLLTGSEHIIISNKGEIRDGQRVSTSQTWSN